MNITAKDFERLAELAREHAEAKTQAEQSDIERRFSAYLRKLPKEQIDSLRKLVALKCAMTNTGGKGK